MSRERRETIKDHDDEKAGGAEEAEEAEEAGEV